MLACVPVARITGQRKRVCTAMADRWPNKKGVAIESRSGQSCQGFFVVTHLVADEKEVQKRKEHWRTVLRRSDKNEFPLARGSELVTSVPFSHRYEHLFVSCDLTYRIALPSTDQEQRVE